MIIILAMASDCSPPVRSRLYAAAPSRVDPPRHSSHWGYLLALLIG